MATWVLCTGPLDGCPGNPTDASEIVLIHPGTDKDDAEDYMLATDRSLGRDLMKGHSSAEDLLSAPTGCPRGISSVSTAATELLEDRPVPALPTKHMPVRSGPLRPGGLAYDYDEDSLNNCTVQ
mmetsp:Transcript_25573/g.56389  ORF Transcript_25573/g.56389 Transcript_25573/m.56389 type:complete len:124 (-) Transcript_25573:110-481(-)|eukprot:CAMPEP_0170614958 /NCGR_PEP_ID=MMETSP0224-20130122/25080_1 /TAXON_ID=285029 /ORGANISM="Togula jolla, Strain CCCM 725" /LENGTH=123 /DNA_ID=CAMNT_0010940655 /DNA_START=50 /DNA_END=421 /DNA_ORIENTATION=+